MCNIAVSKKLNFRVSSALKSIIGKDLITNDFVAIFELVKNSFDAQAKNVSITFETLDSEVNKIIIADDGKGMSYDDIVNKWLFVAYSAKQDGSEDSSQRTYAGNKGVGRFSCDRIGGRLRLQTKTISDSQVHVVDVDWGAFEESSKDKFENIQVNYTTQEQFSGFLEKADTQNSGVILEIFELRSPDSWNRKKLLRLKRSITKLINPFGDTNSPINLSLFCDREIKADKELFEKNEQSELIDNELVNGSIRNPIFSVLKEKTTWFNVELDKEGYFISTLIDRDQLIYKIKESATPYPELIGSSFSCQIFYLNQSAKQTFKLRTGIHSVKFGSLFLFRNGFRVFPVGEEADDYWGIDRRRQQGFSRYLGTRDIMGRVNIAGPESKFRESSSRNNGLVDTRASQELYDFVIKNCIRRLESYVVGVTWMDKIDKTYDTAQRLGLDENRANIISLVSKLSGSKNIELLDYSHNLIDVLHEKSTFFERSVEKLASLAENSDDETLKLNVELARKKFAEIKASEQDALRLASEEFEARLKAEKNAKQQQKLRVEAEIQSNVISHAYEEEKKRNLFLISNEDKDKEQLESFLHQIIIYTSIAKQNITESLLNLNDKSYTLSNDDFSNTLSDLLESVEKIMTTSRFATTANFKLDSMMINDDLCLYIDQYLSTIATAYNSRIQIIVEKNAKPFKTEFTPIELGMVLDNLVSNAKKARSASVLFRISDMTNGVLDIEVVDKGNGLDPSILEPERIFEKGITTTRGSGLGLFHSRKLIEKMGGELIIAEEQPLKGFKIIIRMRKV